MPVFNYGGTQIPFVWDLTESPQETFLQGQSRATAKVLCQYTQRHLLIDAVTGWSAVSQVAVGGAVRSILHRSVPLDYPEHYGLWCVGSPTNSGLSPMGPAPSQVILHPPGQSLPPSGHRLPLGAAFIPTRYQPTYRTARVTLQFSSLPYTVLVDSQVLSEDPKYLGQPDEGDALRRGIRRYIQRQAFPAGKYITVPGYYLYYKQSGNPVPQSQAQFFQPAMDIRYDWYQIPENNLPIQAWNSIPGTLNDATFDGFPKGTLLCMQPTFKTETNAFGQQECTVTYTFRFLPNWDATPPIPEAPSARGHNWFWTVPPADSTDPDKGMLVLREICTRGTTGTNPAVGGNPPSPITPLNGAPPHRSSDFRDLFRPQQPPVIT